MRPHFSSCGFLRNFIIAIAVALSMGIPVHAAPKDEVAAVAGEWEAAFSAHDVDRILNLYSKDALLWGTNGTSLRTTPSEFRRFFESAFGIPNIRVSFESQTIRVFGNVAVVAGTYTFTAGRDNQTPQDSPARYSFTMIKDGERWLIIDHNSSVMPGPRAPTRRT